MNKKILYILLAVALIAVFLGSGYRIPRSVIENAQSVLPAGQSAAPTTTGPDRIPRDKNGNICQLGGCREAEVRGLPPLGGGQ